MSPSRVRRLLRHAAVVPVLLASSACLVKEDTSPRPQPTFTRVILRLTPNGGGQPQQVEITRATKTVSGPLTIPAAGGTLVATYFNVDGTEDEVLKQFQQEYETRIATTAGPGVVNFTRNSANSIQVTTSTPGAATALVQLWDLGLKREVLGTNVTLNVQ